MAGLNQRTVAAIEALEKANERQRALLDMNQFKFERLLRFAESQKHNNIEVWSEVISTIKLDRNQVEELKREEEDKVARNQDS